MKKVLITLSFLSLSLFASSISIDIFTNKSFLNQDIVLDNNASQSIKIPSDIKLKNIVYTLPKNCKLSNFELNKYKNTINDEQIKSLELERDGLNMQLNAFTANDKFLKTMSLKNQKDFSNINELSMLFIDNLISNAKSIKETEKKISILNDKLNNLKRFKKNYKELHVSSVCKKNGAILKLVYPIKSINVDSIFNINANINSKSIELEKKINLKYSGSIDLNDTTLNLYSYKYNQNLAPTKFYPYFLRKNPPVALMKAISAKAFAQKETIQNDVQVSYQQLATKSKYSISNVNLISNKSIIINVNKEIADASFTNVIDGYGTNRAYLQAKIKTRKDYLNPIAYVYLNSKPLGQKRLNSLHKKESSLLYFGENEHIQVKKELIKTLDDKTFFGDKTISTQNWQFKITNNSIYPEDISFIQRVPVSKDANIQVVPSTTPRYTSLNALGKITWDFTLLPNESKTIIFGYEISNSK